MTIVKTGKCLCGFGLLLLFAPLPSQPVMAGEVGTTGANFLKIPIAPIPAAMGHAYTAMVGIDSILYNPAGLGLMSYSAISAVQHKYIEGVTQSYAAIAYRSRFGTVAAAFSVLNSGSIDAYDINDHRIGETQTSHRFGVLAFSQSYPHFNEDRGKHDTMLIHPGWTIIEPVRDYRPKTMRFSVGVSLKYVAETLDNVKSMTFSGDIGILLVLSHHIQIGASMLNITGKQKFYDDSFSLPRTVRIGIAKDFHTVKQIMIFKLTTDLISECDSEFDRGNEWSGGYLKSDLISEWDSKFHGAAGIEIDILKFAQLRGGYRMDRDLGTGLSVGLGLTLKRIRLDYAYLNYGIFGGTHRIGFQLIW